MIFNNDLINEVKAIVEANFLNGGLGDSSIAGNDYSGVRAPTIGEIWMKDYETDPTNPTPFGIREFRDIIASSLLDLISDTQGDPTKLSTPIYDYILSTYDDLAAIDPPPVLGEIAKIGDTSKVYQWTTVLLVDQWVEISNTESILGTGRTAGSGNIGFTLPTGKTIIFKVNNKQLVISDDDLTINTGIVLGTNVSKSPGTIYYDSTATVDVGQDEVLYVASDSGNITTVTAPLHGLTSSDSITVSNSTGIETGFDGADFNGARTITVLDPNTFTFVYSGGGDYTGDLDYEFLTLGAFLGYAEDENLITIHGASKVNATIGQTNTASNLGTGTGLYSTKVLSDLQFKSLISSSSKITFTENTGSDDIDLGIDDTLLSITSSQIIDKATSNGIASLDAGGDVPLSQLGNVATPIASTVPTDITGETVQDVIDEYKIHNHDLLYSDILHNHDASYSALAHNHDASYSALAHNHDASYSALAHNHVGDDILTNITGESVQDVITEYKSHNHDASYSDIIHVHSASVINTDETGVTVQDVIDLYNTHNHIASDIITNTTGESVQDHIDNTSIHGGSSISKFTKTITTGTGEWTGSGPYTHTIDSTEHGITITEGWELLINCYELTSNGYEKVIPSNITIDDTTGGIGDVIIELPAVTTLYVVIL